MKTNVYRLRQPHELLNHILEQPELPAIIQNLEPGVLTRLIRHVGLEDSAEIVSLATADQLKRVFDEDLWYSDAPGREEIFDAERFGLWLEIMLESGPAYAARKIMAFDEDLVTLGMCRLVLVVDLDEIAMRMSATWRLPEDDMLDKVLESTLNQEFDSYLVIAKNHIHWEAILALLAELNELDYTMLRRLLERCCQISQEYIDNNGGLFDVLTADEMLEADVASDRETRRENQGFVSVTAAVSFLNLARTTALKKILAAKTFDPATRAYFKTAKAASTAAADKPRAGTGSARKVSSGHADVNVMRFIKILQEAEVLPVIDEKKVICAPESRDYRLPLVKAMHDINRTNPLLYSRRLMELSYLSNILISGCGFKGRVFRPVEAAEAVFSTCNLGSEYLLGIESGVGAKQTVESLTALLTEHNPVKLFQVGWKILNDDVVLHAAIALLNFLDRLKGELADPSQAFEVARMADKYRMCVSDGRPWEFNDQLDQLLAFFDGTTIMALMDLVQEYPTISEIIDKQEKYRCFPFISSCTHIWKIRQFVKDVL